MVSTYVPKGVASTVFDKSLRGSDLPSMSHDNYALNVKVTRDKLEAPVKSIRQISSVPRAAVMARMVALGEDVGRLLPPPAMKLKGEPFQPRNRFGRNASGSGQERGSEIVPCRSSTCPTSAGSSILDPQVSVADDGLALSGFGCSGAQPCAGRPPVPATRDHQSFTTQHQRRYASLA